MGRKDEWVHYDDGIKAGKANPFAKRLIEDDKVDVVLGATMTGGTLPAAGLTDMAGMPFISMAAGVAIIEPVKSCVFKVARTDRVAAEPGFAEMKKRRQRGPRSAWSRGTRMQRCPSPVSATSSNPATRC